MVWLVWVEEGGGLTPGPATSMSGPYSSTPHGAVYRMVLSEGKRGLPESVILAITFYYCSVLHIVLLSL